MSLPSFPLLDWNEWLPTVHPKDARRIFVAGQFDRSMMKGWLVAMKKSLGVKGSPESESYIKSSLDTQLNYLNLPR